MGQFDYTIVTASDEAYAEGLILLLKSVNRLWAGGSLEVVVLDNGLSDEVKVECEQVFLKGRNDLTIRVESIVGLIPEDWPRFRPSDSVTFYARLWMAHVVEGKDVLYCDSDFMFGFNPRELIDVCREEGASVCAVGDKVVKSLERDCSWKSKLSDGEVDLPYFNSGLMYWNLEDSQFENLIDESMKLLKEVEDIPQFADQTVLNFLFRGKVHFLDEKYNRIMCNNRDLLEWRSNYNIHFTGNHKPFFRGRHHWAEAASNLIFRFLYDGKVDFEAFWRSHFPFKLRCVLKYKMWIYPILNRGKLGKLKSRYVCKKELRKLYDYLVDFEKRGWRNS